MVRVNLSVIQKFKVGLVKSDHSLTILVFNFILKVVNCKLYLLLLLLVEFDHYFLIKLGTPHPPYDFCFSDNGLGVHTLPNLHNNSGVQGDELVLLNQIFARYLDLQVYQLCIVHHDLNQVHGVFGILIQILYIRTF